MLIPCFYLNKPAHEFHINPAKYRRLATRRIESAALTVGLHKGRHLNRRLSNATKTKPLVLDLGEVGAGDVQLVGGKCASLGELFRALVGLIGADGSDSG